MRRGQSTWFVGGTAFFGGPEESGPFNGLHVQYARDPFANVGPVKLPEGMSDDHAILLSGIFPTSWFGAKMAEVGKDDTVAVFGAGIVGQLAIMSAFIQGAGGCWPSTTEQTVWRRRNGKAQKRSTSMRRIQSSRSNA